MNQLEAYDALFDKGQIIGLQNKINDPFITILSGENSSQFIVLNPFKSSEQIRRREENRYILCRIGDENF